MPVIRGFKNFLMRGDLIVIAVGLAIALAFSTLIKAFTDAVITPLVNAAGGGKSVGLGVHVNGQLLNFGAFISAIIYFIIFVAVVYFLIVVPYRAYQARRDHGLRGSPSSQGVPRVPVKRHSGGGLAMQALRYSADRPRDTSRRLSQRRDRRR